MLELFLAGALVGVAVTAPPGPVGGLCIERTMRGGLAAGLATALGALLADAFYGALAAFGLAQVAMPTGWLRQALAVVVALALLFLGVKYLRRALRGDVEPAVGRALPGGGLLSLLAGTFLLTLGTPGTLPAFVAMFTSLDLAARSAAESGGVIVVVAGIVAGAALWWLLLCAVVHRFRAHAARWLRFMEFACAFLLLGGACAALFTGFRA